MEGTLDAADRAPLRGDAREAVLVGSGGLAKAGHVRRRGEASASLDAGLAKASPRGGFTKGDCPFSIGISCR